MHFAFRVFYLVYNSILSYINFKLNEGEFGQYVKYGIPSKKKLRGFPVTKDALLPSGNIFCTIILFLSFVVC